MRKRSCKIPVWLTVFAFSRPVFYVLFRINKPEILNWGEFGEYIMSAFIVTIVIWFFYGIFCLVAKPLESGSVEKEQDPKMKAILATHEFVSGQCKKCSCTEYYIKRNKYSCPKLKAREQQAEKHEPSEAEEKHKRVHDSDYGTPISQFVEHELDKKIHSRYQPNLKENAQEAHHPQESEGVESIDKKVTSISASESKKDLKVERDNEIEVTVQSDLLSEKIEQAIPEKIKKKTPGIISHILVILGWLLIAFSVVIIFGTLQRPLYRNPHINALLTNPDGYALIGTIGLIMGFSFPSIISCLFGIWALARKNPNGKILIIASLIVIIINSVILFLPSSESTSISVNHSISPTIPQSELKASVSSSESKSESTNRSKVTTAPYSKFTVTFPRPTKKKTVTVAGIESVAYECEGTGLAPYLRAEFMDGMHVAAVANDFRTVLENHAKLAGLRLPEITETDNSLGKVGTYSGTKKVGDYTFRVYGKMVIYEWSAINCTIVESLETFPSEETVNFLASIKRK